MFGDLQGKGFDSEYETFNIRSHLSIVYKTLLWVGDTIKEQKPDMVVCMGDVAHVHSSIEIPANNALIKGFKYIQECCYDKLKLVPVYIIAGNHDLESRDGKSNYIEALRNEQVIIVDKTIVLPGYSIEMVPYNDKISGLGGDYLFMHKAIVDAQLNSYKKETEGYTAKDFEKYGEIYGGHYHRSQKIGSNIFLIGSSLCHSFDDDSLAEGFSKNIVLIDTDQKLSQKSFSNPHTPYYVTINKQSDLNALLKWEGTGVFERCNVRSKIPIDDAINRKFLSYKFVETILENSVVRNSDINITSDPIESFITYVNKVSGIKEDKVREEVIKEGSSILQSVKKSESIKESILGRFTYVEAENFMTFKSMRMEFNKKGSTLIEGKNLDSGRAESNGSGKSTIPEILHWTLWGETLRGLEKEDEVINDDSKYCYGGVGFVVDENKVDVKRYRNHPDKGTTLCVSINGEDKSKYTIAETEKLIRDLLNLNKDLFKFLVIIGSSEQGSFPSFASLGPYQRVETIESLVPWLGIYAAGKLVVDKKAEDLKKKLATNEADRIHHTAVLNTNKDTVAKLRVDSDKWEHSHLQETEYMKKQIKELKEKVDTSTKELDTLRADKIKLTPKLNKLRETLYVLRSDLKKVSDPAWMNETICSRCGAEISVFRKADMHKKLEDERTKITKDIANYEPSEKDLTKLLDDSDIRIRNLEEVISTSKSEISSNEKALEKISTNPYINMIDTLQADNVTSQSALDKLNADKIVIEFDTQVNKYLSDILSPKGVRSYVLDSLLDWLNKKILELCDKIFDNEIVFKLVPMIIRGRSTVEFSIVCRGKKRSYKGCSGSERRRIDIVCGESLRRFCESLSKAKVNIIFADEILDSVDRKASEYALNMLSESVECLYIISHDPYIKNLAQNTLTVILENGSSRLKEAYVKE